jgi:hypothetical protein
MVAPLRAIFTLLIMWIEPVEYVPADKVTVPPPGTLHIVIAALMFPPGATGHVIAPNTGTFTCPGSLKPVPPSPGGGGDVASSPGGPASGIGEVASSPGGGLPLLLPLPLLEPPLPLPLEPLVPLPPELDPELDPDVLPLVPELLPDDDDASVPDPPPPSLDALSEHAQTKAKNRTAPRARMLHLASLGNARHVPVGDNVTKTTKQTRSCDSDDRRPGRAVVLEPASNHRRSTRSPTLAAAVRQPRTMRSMIV